MQNGRLLAELRQHYAEYLDDYLAWVADRGYPVEGALVNYRRALIAWYEARKQTDDPYTGDVFEYITVVAERYFTGETSRKGDFPLGSGPLDYLPRTVRLEEPGRELLARLNARNDCRELLLLADYHQLEPAVIARVLDREEDAETLTEEIAACRRSLELESPGGSLLYIPVITVAGRQDLMETLGRNTPPPPPVDSPEPAAAPPKDVRLSPRHRWRIGTPTPAIVVAGLLTGILLWLVYDTFYARASPEGLYATYFAPYPNPFADSPPATYEERDLNQILYYYDRGDYHRAYEELLPTADAYPAAPLYLGVSALALNDPARAEEWLARLPADSPYRDPADWYAALAALAREDHSRARSRLTRITQDANHPYRSQAADLLGEL
ncbi:hypothetical protein GGR26_002674 [Lewinella marina]|uniref:Tetratricopeptide repeat protein n=1 Tax=Neolewinella marina TaxID=438751 RepID=A0A2G0CD74_9BACT|nr:hypothetical protein [Neolewinella marina]NJB86897.1 hypothetical protein [Neolewinella marina]PHK97905.1 hypothetical protein CGL56_13915 [Neolewinella marina]